MGFDFIFIYGQEMLGNIFLYYISGIKFEFNMVCYMGGCGIYFYNDVFNMLVQGNIFYDIIGVGIVIGRFKGVYLDNDIVNEVWVKDNMISNNVVCDIGWDFMQVIGISIMLVLWMIIMYNDVDNVVFMGIYLCMQVLGNYMIGDMDIS